MAKRTNPQNVIESYKRRQQMTPYVIGGLAALLVIVGVVILVFALRPTGFSPAPTETPTLPPATSTSLPATATQIPPTETKISATPTGTATPTVTNTPTGPFEYTVLEKDNCWDIAAKFKVDLNTLLAINSFPAGQCPISPGQKIMVPAPGQTLPTATPVDITKLASGTLLEYVVQPGDTLRAIALAYNSTQQRILDQNKMTDPNKLVAGQKLVIPVNIATQVPTTTNTTTPKPGTPSVTVAPSANVTPSKAH
jgi:LysM repeat protein